MRQSEGVREIVREEAWEKARDTSERSVRESEGKTYKRACGWSFDAFGM